MLYEISCQEFSQKTIIFNDGLSVVLGTEFGDNSIGKSSVLLIVDYVFGGSSYSKAVDISNNVSPHDINFTFKFENEFFHFSRNNLENVKVWKCNADYEKISELTLREFNSWLAEKYQLALPELSYREAVGRYIRVYGKENCDEKHPLHYTLKESSEDASYALVKLFDMYSVLSELKALVIQSECARKAFSNAQKYELISKITKAKYNSNAKELQKLDTELRILKSEVECGFLDVDSYTTEVAISLKTQLTYNRRYRNRLFSKHSQLEKNLTYQFSSTQETFEELQSFFPNVNLAHLVEVDAFNKKISNLFQTEIRTEMVKLQKEINEVDTIILMLEAELTELIQNPKLSKPVLARYAETTKKIEQLSAENESYQKQADLKQSVLQYKEQFAELRQQQFAQVSYMLNEKMSKLNDDVYSGSYTAPILDFKDSGYSFFTPDDTGTGIAYKGLILFDLSVLALTKLPILVHDSVIHKQIADDAVEQIVNLYHTAGKQIIIAFDKQNSYTEKTTEILEECAVLRLGKNGNELFGKSWG